MADADLSNDVTAPAPLQPRPPGATVAHVKPLPTTSDLCESAGTNNLSLLQATVVNGLKNASQPLDPPISQVPVSPKSEALPAPHDNDNYVPNQYYLLPCKQKGDAKLLYKCELATVNGTKRKVLLPARSPPGGIRAATSRDTKSLVAVQSSPGGVSTMLVANKPDYYKDHRYSRAVNKEKTTRKATGKKTDTEPRKEMSELKISSVCTLAPTKTVATPSSLEKDDEFLDMPVLSPMVSVKIEPGIGGNDSSGNTSGEIPPDMVKIKEEPVDYDCPRDSSIFKSAEGDAAGQKQRGYRTLEEKLGIKEEPIDFGYDENFESEKQENFETHMDKLPLSKGTSSEEFYCKVLLRKCLPDVSAFSKSLKRKELSEIEIAENEHIKNVKRMRSKVYFSPSSTGHVREFIPLDRRNTIAKTKRVHMDDNWYQGTTKQKNQPFRLPLFKKALENKSSLSLQIGLDKALERARAVNSNPKAFTKTSSGLISMLKSQTATCSASVLTSAVKPVLSANNSVQTSLVTSGSYLPAPVQRKVVAADRVPQAKSSATVLNAIKTHLSLSTNSPKLPKELPVGTKAGTPQIATPAPLVASGVGWQQGSIPPSQQVVQVAQPIASNTFQIISIDNKFYLMPLPQNKVRQDKVIPVAAVQTNSGSVQSGIPVSVNTVQSNPKTPNVKIIYVNSPTTSATPKVVAPPSSLLNPVQGSVSSTFVQPSTFNLHLVPPSAGLLTPAASRSSSAQSPIGVSLASSSSAHTLVKNTTTDTNVIAAAKTGASITGNASIKLSESASKNGSSTALSDVGAVDLHEERIRQLKKKLKESADAVELLRKSRKTAPNTDV